MKISLSINRRKRQEGSAILIVLTLILLMMAIMASNHAALNQLRHEIDFIEEKQVERWSGPKTNTPGTKKP